MHWRIYTSRQEPFPETVVPPVPQVHRCLYSEWESDDHYTLADEAFLRLVRIYQKTKLHEETIGTRFENVPGGQEMVISLPHEGVMVELARIPVDTRDSHSGDGVMPDGMLAEGDWYEVGDYVTAVINNFMSIRLADAKEECGRLLSSVPDQLETWLQDNREKVGRQVQSERVGAVSDFLDEILPGRWYKFDSFQGPDVDDYALFAQVSVFGLDESSATFPMGLFAFLGRGLGGREGERSRKIELGRVTTRLFP